MSMPPIPPWEGSHPIIVHFPVALLLVAPLFMVLGLALRKGGAFSLAGLVLLVLGTLGAVLAVASGEAAHEAAEGPGAVGAVLERHEELGELARTLFLVVTVAYTAALIVPRVLAPARRRPAATVAGVVVLLAHAGGLLVLANAAHEGGRLVHEFGVRAALTPGGEGGPGGAGQGGPAGRTEEEDDDDD